VPLSALALALGAAVVHAIWNLLLARARDPQAATAVAMAFGCVVFAPVAVVTWDVRAGAWPWVVASSLLELAYFALLALAYSRAELSAVYPLARGSAPVIVLLVSVVFLGTSLSAWAGVGVLLVAIGVVLVRGFRERAGWGESLLALAVGVAIAGYTLVDKEGLRHADPLPYLELVLVVPALVYLGALARSGGGDRLRTEIGLPSLLAGIGMFAAYGLVLAALRLAPAAPVAAVRETSIVMGVVLGALVLREAVGRARVAGAVVIVLGVAAIALA
jgi:drug/metabolite transporter (DMT)-like permease